MSDRQRVKIPLWLRIAQIFSLSITSFVLIALIIADNEPVPRIVATAGLAMVTLAWVLVVYTWKLHAKRKPAPSLTCRICGNSLARNETECARCGMQVH